MWNSSAIKWLKPWLRMVRVSSCAHPAMPELNFFDGWWKVYRCEHRQMKSSNPENIRPERGTIASADKTVTPDRLSTDSKADGPTAGEPVKKLTADEQMDLYEQHLKENDWGHQPC